MRSVSVGRRPAITSSSSSSFGSVASARATSSRLRSGKVSDAGQMRALVVQVEPPQHLVRAARRAPSTSDRRSSAPTMTLSSTVSAGNGRTIWKVRPMPRRQTASGVSPSMRSPPKRDRAVVRREHAGDHVEQRGLAGAVRPDHREDLALRHVEADVGRRRAGRGSASLTPSTSRSALMSVSASRGSPSRAREPAARCRPAAP